MKINLRVEIEVPRGPYRGKYVSRIEDIFPDRFHVAMPMFRGYYVSIPRGTRVWVSYVKDKAVYYLETEVLERIPGPVPRLVLALPERVERVQRRRFVRFEAALPVAYQKLTEGQTSGLTLPAGASVSLGAPTSQPSTNQEGLVPEPVLARTADISGGGIMLVAEEDIPVGTRLALLISLPQAKIKAEGKVTRLVKTMEVRGKTNYFLGVEFTSISDWDQDRIIGYIFEEQRKMRWKGLFH